jgi:anti-sigma regulatory factor (Ser/Thr protein kinase)
MTPSSEAYPWRRLAEYSLPSATGSTSLAIENVTEAVQTLHLPEPLLTRLQRVIAEVIDNTIVYDLSRQVKATILLQVNLSARVVPAPVEPSVPLGWGFFVVERMVEIVSEFEPASQHEIDLYLYQECGEPQCR